MSAYTDADVEAATAELVEAPLENSEAQDVRLILDAVAPAIAARALREFAAATLATYPEDIWPEPTAFGDSIARRSASVARLVARQAAIRAGEIESGTP